MLHWQEGSPAAAHVRGWADARPERLRRVDAGPRRPRPTLRPRWSRRAVASGPPTGQSSMDREGTDDVRPVIPVRRVNRTWTIRAALAAWMGVAGTTLCRPAWCADPERMYVELSDAYDRELDELARWAHEAGMVAESRRTGAWRPVRQPDRLYLFLPDDPDRADRSAVESAPVAWRSRFDELRRNYAAELWRLTAAALRDGRISLACRLAHEVLREDPDHGPARQALGYVRIGGTWRTPYERDRIRRGDVWHDRFGWIASEDVAQYERGMRRSGSGWISAEEDKRRHDRIENGWKIETAHVQITTNDSLEGGVRIARRLEKLYALWRQVFADYWVRQGDAERRFLQGDLFRFTGRPFQVTMFHTREEYVRVLRRHQPMIDMTLGIYFDRHRRGYFFAGQGQDPGTLYHEATHQFFHESRRTARQVGTWNNFWIVEGIAAYMESLRAERDYWVLGGRDADRVAAARSRLGRDGFYVPLGRLARMGTDDLQRAPEIQKLYSQMAAAATFLMHYDAGRYRTALMRYLRTVYEGRSRPDTLAQLTGTRYDVLDEQYREFLQ